MDARELNEAQLAEHIEELLGQIGLSLDSTEVSIGAFRLDAVAHDKNGDIVIVELKVVASRETLGQLLTYPHVVRKRLEREGGEKFKVRSLLITTHLDKNVVDIVESLKPIADISLKVCCGSLEKGLRLVDPGFAGNQVWDQATVGRRCDIRVVDGRPVFGPR